MVLVVGSLASPGTGMGEARAGVRLLGGTVRKILCDAEVHRHAKIACVRGSKFFVQYRTRGGTY